MFYFQNHYHFFLENAFHYCNRATLNVQFRDEWSIQAYLNDQSPGCLHGHRDEGDDGVCQGQVEDQVVHVGPAHHVYSGTETEGQDSLVSVILVNQQSCRLLDKNVR